MKIKIYISIVFVALLFSSCYKEEVLFYSDLTPDLQMPLVLKFNHVDCSYDSNMEILRYNISGDSLSEFTPFVEFLASSSVIFNAQKLENNSINNLGSVQINKAYSLEISNKGTVKSLKIIFTNLPVIQIISDNKIYDEPKSLARIQINSANNAHCFSSFAGLELRGGYSREYNKKSMGFELWKGMTRELEYSAELLGFQKNNDWIIGAAFIDPSRIRNLVSFEIWNGLQINSNDHFGIHSRMVEVFLNDKFLGIYIFSEMLNQELLHVNNNAVLYKGIDWSGGATKFETYNPEVSINQFWNGWEQKIPFSKEKLNWNPLNDLYKLAVNGTNEAFKENIASRVNIDNLIDYFLFLNLACAVDNTGKNCFLFAENSNVPLQYIPWDFDGSWGILYDGSKIKGNSVLTNNLFKRLLETNPENFREKMKNRWFYLRENNFSEKNINEIFSKHFLRLTTSDIIQMENLIWGVNLDISQEQAYINNWTSERLTFLDEYFIEF